MPKGYKSYTKGKQVKVVTTNGAERPDLQGAFARKEEHERMDQYAKPGTSAAKRQSDPYETSFPTSRYRSRRP